MGSKLKEDMIISEDKLKLLALDYAEKNKIVNQKSINAYMAGFRYRDNVPASASLNHFSNRFKNNAESARDDAGYGDYRGKLYENRMKEADEARELANQLIEISRKIKEFNDKYNRQY